MNSLKASSQIPPVVPPEWSIIRFCVSLMAIFVFAVESAAQVPPEISIATVAGGGFGSNVPVRQAPMVQPTACVFDPLGRGFYVVDEVNGTSLLRFVNTGTAPVTLAGTTIQPLNINLIAGGGLLNSDNAIARDTDLAQITGLAVSSSGNLVFMTIPAFSAIRVINVGLQAETVIGRSIPPGTVSTIFSPAFFDFRGLTLHPATGEIYFIAGRIVYRLDGAGVLSTFAGGGTPPNNGNGDGGPATSARIIAPMGLVFDRNNNLIIAEGGDLRTYAGAVRLVNSRNEIFSVATNLEFPTGVAAGPAGDIFVAVGNGQQIVQINTRGEKSVVAGSSTQRVCDQFQNPSCGDGGLATDAFLNIPDSTTNTTLMLAARADGIYLPDYRFRRLRFINLSTKTARVLDTDVLSRVIRTVVGSGITAPYDDSQATSSDLFAPTGIAADFLGNLFISDTGNNRLRYVNRTSSPITLFVTTPYAQTVQPGQIVTLNKNNGDFQTDDRITTAFFLSPQGLAYTSKGLFIVDSQAGALIKIPPTVASGRRSGVIRFLNLSGAEVVLFPNNAEARVSIPPGQIKDIAGVRPPNNPQTLGDGQAAGKVAFFPTDVAVDRNGNIFIADQGNNRIRRIDASTGLVSTFYGDGTTAVLNGPTGIAFDAAGRLHIADTRNNRVLRQNEAGSPSFSVIADQSRGINRPRDLTVDSTGKVFVTCALTSQVMEVTAPNNSPGTARVVAGTGNAGFSGDDGPAQDARLNLPNPGTAINDIQVTTNILTLPNGDLLFADTNNNRIRTLLRRSSTPPVVSVSAASFSGTEIAVESIVAAFGTDLATMIEGSTTRPLPTTLGGTSMKITDSFGFERQVPLFFVSSNQINYQVPPGTLSGPALVTVTSSNGTVSTGTINIVNVSPGLFSADASGQGLAAAYVLRVKSDGSQTNHPVAQFNPTLMKFEAIPIDLGPATDQLFLVLYGTGLRYRSSLATVTAQIGGANAEVLYVGPADGYVGLDQVNLRIPRSLAGIGTVTISLSIDGKPTNSLTMQIK